MSTNSYIGVQCEDGIRAIYCHFDGYPAGVGATLNKHYTDFMKVCTLINNGDLSSLGAEIGEKHDFDNRPDGVCNYYGRDREEDDCGFDMHGSEAAFLNKASNVGEYAYLFNNGTWTTYKL